jgi:sulfur-oxidizing protein SoxY
MSTRSTARFVRRRLALKGGVAITLLPCLPARAADIELPAIPALSEFLANRQPRWERVRLTLPRLADNGNAVPMKVIVDGPFPSGRDVASIRLFSETNPVADMVEFQFPLALGRVEVESRVRLASTQRIVAIATLRDATLLAAQAEVVVTLAGCMDGT